MEEKLLYNVQKRGAAMPVYTPAENKYRTRVLDGLQMSYKIREMTHQEFNDKTYSEYYLINRQQGMAYNPPKRNVADSRIALGITHEKELTIQSIIEDMNFQPKICAFDHDNKPLVEAATVFTAKLKDSLIKDDFDKKLSEFVFINTSQGNVFVDNKRIKKYKAVKTETNVTEDPTKTKWKTTLEMEDCGFTSVSVPNTGVFLSNILERDMHKQPRIWVVLHVPTEIVAQMFKDFPRWDNVPKSPTQTIPVNIDGIWGDYFLQQPSDQYCEIIMTQSEMENDYNVFINGVMMYQVQEENGVVTGYPLTHFSPSGKYTLVKGDNEPIPFFAYALSEGMKTEVKEEAMNELVRLMFYKLRQSAKPPVGNNSTRVLPANIWDPGVITPDIRHEDISILTPNAGVTNGDFSFMEMMNRYFEESTVSDSVGGTTGEKTTATQYLDQKRANLKKVGTLLDQTINFLREMYWLRLFDEINNIDIKKKKWDSSQKKFIEAYQDFAIDENIDGRKGRTNIVLTDTPEDQIPNLDQQFQDEETSPTPIRTYYVKPSYMKEVMNNLQDKIYIEVISEPEGQNVSLLSSLFNILTSYVNLKGGDSRAINFEYLERIIDQNSGFDENKMFVKVPPQPIPGATEAPGATKSPMTPAPSGNGILANPQ